MAIDRETERPIDKEIAHLQSWFDQLTEKTQKLSGVKDIDDALRAVDEGDSSVEMLEPETVRRVFEHWGANFEINDIDRRSLQKYTNAGKANGMRAIWGKKFDDYKTWCKEWGANYELETGKTLPRLGKAPEDGQNDTRSYTSGMIQLFGSFTSYGAGEMDFRKFISETLVRIYNGHMWKTDRKDQRKRLRIPTADKPILVSSVPLEFPKEMIKYLSH